MAFVTLTARRRRFDGPLYRLVARQERGSRKVWKLSPGQGEAPRWIGTSTWERGGVVLDYETVADAFREGNWEIDPTWRD